MNDAPRVPTADWQPPIWALTLLAAFGQFVSCALR